MMLIRFAVTGFAFLALLNSGRSLAADKPNPDNGKSAWLNSLTARLGLNTQQQDTIRKNHEEFDKKADPLEQQSWAQCQAERQAIRQVLDAQQQTKFDDGLRTMRHKEIDKVATKLGLNAEQQQQMRQLCDQFEKKFEEAAAGNEQGEKQCQQFRQIRDEFLAALRPQLNEEQRFKLPFLIREEHRHFRDPAVRRSHLIALENNVGVNDQQRQQIQKINETYEKQAATVTQQLAQVRKEEHEALENTLNAEQREKLREMRKAYGGEQN
jgi:hypothetical protein